MITNTKNISKSYAFVSFGVTEKTPHLFMLKIREAIESILNKDMTSIIHVHKFVLGGLEKGKVGESYSVKKKEAMTAVELSNDGEINRMYAMGIKNFSISSLQYIFVNHINRETDMITDNWKRCRAIVKANNINQHTYQGLDTYSDKGKVNFNIYIAVLSNNMQRLGNFIKKEKETESSINPSLSHLYSRKYTQKSNLYQKNSGLLI